MRSPGWKRLVVGGWLLCAAALTTVARAGVDDGGCQRFLVDERVFVSVQFQADGTAGGIAWLDTVSGRRGDAPFATDADSVLQVEMPGGWCSRAFYLGDLALLFRNPPWDPAATTVALGVSLD
ncbi:MAG: hypothetical protein P1P84_00835 [Deferrisomatales bacterium]|nr:hypothetical protein [Deferrisomatales bacterium]HSH70874.1 hypothetical protein [Deferrisomatales bacterium]